MWLKRFLICTLVLALNMATFVQSAIGEADPAVPTLASAPTDGNLLVCIAMERSDASAVTTPSGWTLAFERYPQQGNPSNRRSLVCFYRIASGDSTTPISVAFNSTGTIKAILAEFALDTGNGEDQWILDAVQSNDNGTTADAQTLSSGTTASVSGTRFLIIGALGYREGTGGAHLFTSWTNDVNDEIHSSGGTNGRNVCLGYGTRTTAGTQETTATWNMQGGTNSGATTGIVVFDLVAAAVPSVGTTGLEDNQVYPPYALQGGGIRPPINSTGKLFRPGPGGGGLSRLRGTRPPLDRPTQLVTHKTVSLASLTLAANAGSYAITGAAANLEFGRILTAESGSYAITGTAASTKVGRKAAADSGSYTISGTEANLEVGYRLVAASGTYAISGTDANLVYNPAGAYSLTADGGTYAITGTAANPEYNRLLAATGGTYAISGTDATLKYGRSVGPAQGGSYTLTGFAADLIYSPIGNKTLAADAGVYQITGTAATLSVSSQLTAVTITEALVTRGTVTDGLVTRVTITESLL